MQSVDHLEGGGDACNGSAFSAWRGWRKATSASLPGDPLPRAKYLLEVSKSSARPTVLTPSSGFALVLTPCSGSDTLLRF
jgi:hypothetical protein